MSNPATSAPTTITTHSPNNYELMLRESVTHFLAEHKKGVSDFSSFLSIFSRILQTMTDPPLEFTWFYSAVAFHGSLKSTADDPLKRGALTVVGVKDSFQLITSCCNQCSGMKRVAALAPVLYKLWFCLRNDLGVKREIEGLLEGIVNYIVMCCLEVSERGENEMRKVAVGFADLIRVWTVDQVGENCELGERLRVFFPLVSVEVLHRIIFDGEISYLAGVVMLEAFLLRLSLKFGNGISREELQKDIRNWAVQTITGFGSSCFFDMLLGILSEPTLPVGTLLSPEDEILLKEVLYDVVMLVEYSFLKPQTWTQLSGDYLKDLALTWLLVADNAIEFARDRCDETRAIAYTEAFSKYFLTNQLLMGITCQTNMQGKISIPSVNTPRALIRWLLVLETQGVRLFGRNVLQLHEKAVLCRSNARNEARESKHGFQNPNGNKVDEDQEMADSWDDTFSHGCPIHSAETEGTKKRKEGRADYGEPRFKLAKKFSCDQTSAGEGFLPRGNGGNEVTVQYTG